METVPAELGVALVELVTYSSERERLQKSICHAVAGASAGSGAPDLPCAEAISSIPRKMSAAQRYRGLLVSFGRNTSIVMRFSAAASRLWGSNRTNPAKSGFFSGSLIC